ncbi:hypothetical protein ASG90_13685 [Nocardioides sp. Soil797]|nr:hypothetical protein ASG90_13685 [Nocardioides sp. Soil797]
MSITRLGLLTGPMAFLAVIAGLASDTLPGGDVTDARLASYVDQHGYGVFLTMGGGVALGGLLLLVFVSALATRLEEAGASPAQVRLAQSAGTIWSMATIIAGIAWITPFVAHVGFTSAPPTADVNLVMAGLGYGSLALVGGIAAALVAATVTAVALRTSMLPRWLAVAGIPASLLILANVVLPMAVLTLWFTAVTVCLVRRPAATGAPTLPRMAPAAESLNV